MPTTCLLCGGDGITATGEPCPNCSSEALKKVPVFFHVPVQYQGVRFDKSFLPDKEQSKYGTFMEELLVTIVNDFAFYQKNMIICSRPNSGKTVWSYNLYSVLMDKGYSVPSLKDVVEVRNILNSWDNKEEADLFSNARCAIIKIPRDAQPWVFDTISYIVERRVRSNGFTIFLFGGSYDDLKLIDRYGKLKYLEGTGAYNTVKIESFD